MSDRLTLTYGLRWEVNPAVKGINGSTVYAVTDLDHPAQLQLAPVGTPLYQTTFANIAPRLGISYRLRSSPGKETVIRGGVGRFYDTGFGLTGGVSSEFPNYPYNNYKGTAYPLLPAQAAIPPYSTSYPVTEILVADPHLQLPRTDQWNLTVEQGLGQAQSVSVTYAAALGRKLLRNEYLIDPNEKFTYVLAVRNGATSDYHSLQLRFQRRLSRGLQALASYTWAHSIDLASNDAEWGHIPLGDHDPNQDRGSSDFDIRHALRAAVTWTVPAPLGPRLRPFLSGFSLDSILTLRSATPVDLIGGIAYLRYLVNTRPDRAPNQPLYIHDASAAGGRRLNPEAFLPTPVDDYYSAVRQGTLGRNVVRGFGLSQLDLAVRREFRLAERATLQFRAEAFNLVNHPNFANPEADLASGLFGISTQMLGRGLGSGGPTSGLTPLYQVGGPRSLQLALRLRF